MLLKLTIFGRFAVYEVLPDMAFFRKLPNRTNLVLIFGGFFIFLAKRYLVTLCKPEIGATRCTLHENHQKLLILLLFWRFFEIFGQTLSGNTLQTGNGSKLALPDVQFTKITKNCHFWCYFGIFF